MPTKTYSLSSNEPETLAVTWQGAWKKTRVEHAGALVLEFDSQKDLKAGREVTLHDGRTLRAQLTSRLMGSQFNLTVDGNPIPGSPGDPAVQLKGAYEIIFFVAGLSAGLGLIAQLFDISFLKSLGLGWASILFGAVYAVLGYFTKQQSRVALAIAVILFTLDTIALFIPTAGEFNPPIGAVFVRLFFLAGMAKGFPAIQELRKQSQL